MTTVRTTFGSELLLQIDVEGGGSGAIHHRIERDLRAAIASGRLGPGAALPSSRALAEQLGLSRGVVVEAYEQLVAEGYLTSRRGSATRVNPRIARPAPTASPPSAPAVARYSFAYGSPDVAEFPRAAWLRSLRRVLNDAPSARLGYLDARGTPELRTAIAGYLNRVRGTAADGERVVICNGFAQGIGLIAQLLAAGGASRIATEDPGQLDAPAAARRFRLETIPIPVDEDGIVVEALERSGADAVVVTPAHHFPTGAVLSAERRAALLSWAAEGQRLIVEDDYDAEYRYDRKPIGALQGLAPDRVIYAGSASKTLAPGLRLGWLIVPGRLVTPLAAVKWANDRGSASIEQLALADFLVRGEFDRHLRRMRSVYRDRRGALLESLARHAPALRPAGSSAGLHLVAWLPAESDEEEVIARASELGVGLAGLATYNLGSAPRRGGLLFGYGGLSVGDIDEGVRRVAEALAPKPTAWPPEPGGSGGRDAASR